MAKASEKDQNVVSQSEEDVQPNTAQYMQIRNFKIRIPGTPAKRMWLGVGLTFIGVFPGPPGPAASLVGISILSIDNPRLRKARRKSTVWNGRRTWGRLRTKSLPND